VTQWVAELTFAVLEHDAAAFIYLVPPGDTISDTTLNLWAHEVVPPSRSNCQALTRRPWRVGRVRNPKAAEGQWRWAFMGLQLRGPTLSRAALGGCVCTFPPPHPCAPVRSGRSSNQRNPRHQEAFVLAITKSHRKS